MGVFLKFIYEAIVLYASCKVGYGWTDGRMR